MSIILSSALADLYSSLGDTEEKLTITEVSWKQYEKLLAEFGDSATYRTIYLDRTLEIRSPSRRHEISKKNLARLLEVYLELAEIDFWGLGSTTLRRQENEAGKEPDECYCLYADKEFPDLAIEIIITSGSEKILEVYRRLEIKEVWLWQNEELKIYSLQNNQYYLLKNSDLLPNLDLKLLSQYVNYSNPRLAIKEFRAKLQENY